MNKKMIKVAIIFFICGILVSWLTTTIAYSLSSNDISYSPENPSFNVDNVSAALNKLYTASSSYKNLTTNTTITADKLLYGETAYNSEGNLITGSYKDKCKYGSMVLTSACNTSAGCELFGGINASKFFFYVHGFFDFFCLFDENVDPNNYLHYKSDYKGLGKVSYSSNFVKRNNKVYGYNFDSGVTSQTMYYFACE